MGYRLSENTAELGNMFVLDEYRGRGIGTKLVNAFLDWCKEKGYTHITTDPAAQNKKGIEFYKKFGFKEYTTVMEINPDNKRV